MTPFSANESAEISIITWVIILNIYSHHSLENIAASNNANCLETYANLTIIALIDTRDHPTVLLINRPYRGFQHCLDGLAKRSEITVFVWESDGKQLFQNRILQNLWIATMYVKILGGRFYLPSLKDVSWLERTQLIFLIFHRFVCKFGRVEVAAQENIGTQSVQELFFWW